MTHRQIINAGARGNGRAAQHRVTGRWRLGLALALLATVCWGVLAIALKVLLERMDPYTITWYRFTVAAAVLGAVLAVRSGLPSVSRFGRGTWALLATALVGLVGNYVLFLVALAHTTPTINQTVVQLSPLFLLGGGMVVYGERFSRSQWIGFGLLIAGLLLFFNRRLPELAHLKGGLGLGVAILVVASLLWAAYALAQKALLKTMGSPQILWLVYVGAVALLLPAVHAGQVRGLDGLGLSLLGFCCANTLIGYGAFAEALEHWDVSRVSAILALTPLVTFCGMFFVGRLWPGVIAPEHLGGLSAAGAVLVVAGSALCAFGQRR